MVKTLFAIIGAILLIAPINGVATELYEPEAENYSRVYMSFPGKVIGVKAHFSNSIESSISTEVEVFLDDLISLSINKNHIGLSINAYLSPIGYEYKVLQIDGAEGLKNSLYYQWYTQ